MRRGQARKVAGDVEAQFVMRDGQRPPCDQRLVGAAVLVGRRAADHREDTIIVSLVDDLPPGYKGGRMLFLGTGTGEAAMLAADRWPDADAREPVRPKAPRLRPRCAPLR